MKRDNDVRPLEGRYCHHKTVSAVVNWCIKTSLTWCNENAIALEGCKHQTQKFRGCNKWRCVTQWGTVSKASFLLSVETNPGLLWFCRKIAPASQKIKCKTKSNRGLVIHVFTRFPNRDYFGFPSLRSVIGLENSHLDQSDTKQNPSATRSLLFSPPLKKFASRALHLTVSFLLLSDVIAQYAGTLCMVSSSSNFSDSGNRGFKPRFWIQARILRYRVLKLSESRNV